jgi:hypothetical protein
MKYTRQVGTSDGKNHIVTEDGQVRLQDME